MSDWMMPKVCEITEKAELIRELVIQRNYKRELREYRTFCRLIQSIEKKSFR